MKTGTSIDRATKDILQKQRIRPIKSLGQNFLIDQNILHKIANTAQLNEEDLVIEIGPGLGALTQILVCRAASVVAVELDRRMIPILTEQLAGLGNLKIVHGDALKLNYQELIASFTGWKKIKLVANLPYYISTPLIFKLLTEPVDWDQIVIMVQKEVAERISAEPGSKDYGQLSILVQYRAQANLVFKVPPTVFVPRPKVDSAVIRMVPWKAPPVNVLDEKLFFQVVKAAFAQRRKTLRNNLANLDWFGGNKSAVETVLKELNIDPNRRGETLSLEDFARIANFLIQTD